MMHDTPTPSTDDDLPEGEQPQGELFTPPPAPGFVRKVAPSHRVGRGWWLAAVGLVLLAGLQWLWVERERLATNEAWRPTVLRVCGWLGCSVPAWHQPDAFQVTARDVRPHPSVDGALLITASFRNDAAFAQRWPLLQLTLSDLDGRMVGSRRFTAAEYLGDDPADALLQPAQSVRVTLEVVDADRETVAFAFDFH